MAAPKQVSRATCIKVRTKETADAVRIFSSVTHPTEKKEASRLTFTGDERFPASLGVLLGVLCEEFGATIGLPNLGFEAWIEELPTPIRERAPSFVEDEMLQQVRMPPPPPEIVCEFDLLVGEFVRPAGRRTAVVFNQFTFTFPKPRVKYVDKTTSPDFVLDGSCRGEPQANSFR